MANIDLLISQGETTINGVEKTLLKSLPQAEAEIFREIMSIFDSLNITGGKLSNNAKTEQFLASLDDRINRALLKSGYSDGVYAYLRDFKKIENNIRDLHSAVNKVEITADQIDPIRRIETNNALNRLTGAGISKDFTDPLRQALYRNTMFGASFSDTEKLIREYVLSGKIDSKLSRYVKQVSRDAVSQFDGAVQANIAKELKLNAKFYTGSLVVDSRSQCKRWVEKQILFLDELQDEIDWAVRNGSGMIPGTTVETFDIYRGGYNCRHRSIPTYRKK